MAKIGKKFEDFVGIVMTLRKECPWDQEQTLESLKPYLVEEVYEAIQAIDDKDYDRLAEEIGDMLLHIGMLSVMLREKSKFSVETIIDTIKSKMIRRHPHVFGKGKARTKEEVLAEWKKIKAREKRRRKASDP